MPAARDRDALVAALTDTFESIIELGASLSDDQWDTPSEVPGWSVKDNFSHMVGTEAMLLGRQAPDIEVPDAPHLRNDIAKFNEAWVLERRPRSGADVLDELRGIWAERRAELDAKTQADFDAESFTPAGKDTYGRFMQIRVFDCWIHEQDCLGALGRAAHHSGPAVETALDELTTAMGFVVGKRAGAAEGQSVRLDLTGPAARTIDVLVEGRAAVVPSLPGPPTATIAMPVTHWFRLISGRWPANPDHPAITLDGDLDLARRVIEHANYTI